VTDKSTNNNQKNERIEEGKQMEKIIKESTKKKIITLALALSILAITAAGCSTATPTAKASSDASSISMSSAVSSKSDTPYESRTLIKIATLKGPTGMGMVKLFSDNEAKTTANRYVTTIAGAPDLIVGKISSGEIDIAAVPTNLAATLYNKTGGKIQILALNTLGVLNILEKGDTVKTFADLKGKKLFASGKGSTPEFVLNYLLLQNGIDPLKDITIEYKTEHSELAALALSGKADLVMIPEPFVTTILSKNIGFKSILDMTTEWSFVTEKLGIKDSVLSMGCVVVSKDFATANKQAVIDFLDEYKASIDYTNVSQNAAADLIAKYEIMPSASLAKLAIPNSNIVFVEGEVMKNQILNFYNVLFMADPKSLGGKMPDDAFYYIR
jgi:NitT/TauT family transport system substrate-binding protein